MLEYQILLFYKYVEISEPEKMMSWQRDLCEKLSLKGRIIIAKEGINATLEGLTEKIEEYWLELIKIPEFKDIHRKQSTGNGQAFPKLSVKVRPEIVSLHLPNENDIDPRQLTGNYLQPEELKKWFETGKRFFIVDMRNDYECQVGHFKNSFWFKDMDNFRDLPKVLSQIEHLKKETILTVCTGGIRCEKASGFLLKNGFKEVYQLSGGIVSYMEKYPNQDFLGKLYVFDNRLFIGFNTDSENHVVVGKCQKCGIECENYIDYTGQDGKRKHEIICEKCILEYSIEPDQVFVR